MSGRVARWGVYAAAPAVAVCGFLAFRPDWYHNQNGLDPYFYSGMAQNLSNVIDQGAAGHYFLSRWTLYIPELLSERVLGASVGFIAVRLILLCVAGWSLAGLRRPGSRTIDVVAVTVTAVFAPLVIRAVFVDYSDAVIVPCGLAAIVLATRAPVRWSTAAGIGALAAASLIANVFAVFTFVVVAALFVIRARSPRRIAVAGAVALAVAGAIVLAGLAFFRWRYGVHNVYGPTVDFIRDNTRYHDPLKSPRLLWLGYRLWIYLPLVILLVAWQLRRLRLAEFSPADRLVLGACAAQYVFQVAYQFVRDGSTLEIHYYFAYMIPAYTAALAVVLYALLDRCSARVVGGITAAVAALLVLLPWPDALRLPNWVVAAAAVFVAGVLVRRMAALHSATLPAVLLLLVFGLQSAFPTDEPRRPGEERVLAQYDEAYRSGRSRGVAAFEQLADFLAEAKKLDVDVFKRSGFVIGDGFAPQLAAGFSVQVAQPSHWLNPSGTAAPFALSPASVTRLTEAGFRYLVLMGAPDQIPRMGDRLAALGVRTGEVLLDWRSAGPRDPTRVTVVRVA